MFKNNKKEGYGVKKWANGSVYEGYWHNDKMHGEGTFTWPQGDVYQGNYNHGIREGKGTKTWASGTEYTVSNPLTIGRVEERPKTWSRYPHLLRRKSL